MFILSCNRQVELEKTHKGHIPMSDAQDLVRVSMPLLLPVGGITSRHTLSTVLQVSCVENSGHLLSAVKA